MLLKIDQDSLERGFLLLASIGGNQYDEPRVKRGSCGVSGKELLSVVGDQNPILIDDPLHEDRVSGSIEPDLVDMPRMEATLPRDFCQARAQILVDQKLHGLPVIVSRYRQPKS